jgi:hypothetical protein
MFHPGFDLEMTYAKHQKHKLDMEKIYHYNGLNQLVSVIDSIRSSGDSIRNY